MPRPIIKALAKFLPKPSSQSSYAVRRTTSAPVSGDLKSLLSKFKSNARRIKLINKALRSQSRSSLGANTKQSLRRGYKAGPDVEAFEGLTTIRKNQANIIKRLRQMGHKTPSRAFKASR